MAIARVFQIVFINLEQKTNAFIHRHNTAYFTECVHLVIL